MSDVPVDGAELTHAFETTRSALVRLAYRMLGDVGRAEDIVQDAWLRALPHRDRIRSPRSFFIKTVTRLCLTELDSARVRREESRGDRLPEPIDLGETRMSAFESLDQISMAFVVLLQRLSPAERAILLLHEVFGYEHTEASALVGKSPAACRQLLSRARRHVQEQRRSIEVSADEHRRLLHGFLAAARSGDLVEVERFLTDDVLLVVDGGTDPAPYGRLRNLPRPVRGLRKVAAFLAAAAPQGDHDLTVAERLLNGEPAVFVRRDGAPYATISIAIRDGKVSAVFLQADPRRLQRLQ